MKDYTERNRLILEKSATMPLGELAKEMKLSDTHLTRLCKKLGVNCIGVKERNIKFILANYKTMKAQEIAEKLRLELFTLTYQYAKELNISFTMDEGQKKEMWKAHMAKRVGNKFSRPTKPSNPSASERGPIKNERGAGNSPGAILAAFKMDGDHHYNEPGADPIEREREKVRHYLQKLNKKVK